MKESIFNSFKENNNDEFSKLNPYDLDYLLNKIDDYYINYRKKINLPKGLTFGTEIEIANANIYEIKRKIDLNMNLSYPWNTDFESSVERGSEVNSPIMEDLEFHWEDLKTVCNILNEISEINQQTGSHVHIGAQILGSNKQAWLNFIKIWSTYENVIYRFTNGEYINTRIGALEHAMPIKSLLEEVYKKYKYNSKTLYNMLATLSNDRYQAVNFMNVFKINVDSLKDKNTIEFRTPNGTLDYIIIQNNINFFTKLLLYSKEEKFNDDVIEKRRRSPELKNIEYEMYNEIYLSQTLEFVDLIFDNNLDKINFLKQYLKSFEKTERLEAKCKKLTSR